MRARLMVMAVFLFLSISSTLQAQGAPSHWYYATVGKDSAKLVAYTPDGDGKVVTLIDSGVTPDEINGWQLDNDITLVAMTVDGKPGLYKLTNSRAELIIAYGQDDLGIGHFTVLDYHSPYVLITSAHIEARQMAYLVNLDTQQVDPLSAQSSGGAPNSCCRFSEDGKTLRYVGTLSADDKTATLWERDLSTGQERALYTLPEHAILQPDYFGEHWLQGVYDQTTQMLTYTLVSIDGSTRKTYEAPLNDPQLQQRQVFAGKVVMSQTSCEGKCPVELQDLNGSTLQTFQVPAQKRGTQILPLRSIADGGWISEGTADGSLWLFSGDGTVMPLGYYNPRIIFQPVPSTIAPDGQYVLTLNQADSPQSYQVWDTETKTPVVNEKITDPPAYPVMVYGDGGFLVNDVSSATAKTLWYTYDHHQMTTLPGVENRAYFIPQGPWVIYDQVVASETQAGIYRYAPAADTSTLLVPDGRPFAFSVFSTLQAMR